jgi:hypothetical protein
MGTNFYMTPEVFVSGEPVHLGKSSAGWQFTFRGDKANGVVDVRSWYARVERLAKEGYTLTNDNGSDVSTPVDLLKLIRDRKQIGAKFQRASRENEWNDQSGNFFLDGEFC